MGSGTPPPLPPPGYKINKVLGTCTLGRLVETLAPERREGDLALELSA